MSDHTENPRAVNKPDPETMVDRRIKFVGLRMTEELCATIKDRADHDGRSIGKQIIHYLEQVPDLKGETDTPDAQNYSGLPGHRYRAT